MYLEEKLITYKAGDKAGKPIENAEALDRTDRGAIENLTKNSDIFNQQTIAQIRPLIIDTIQDYGLDTAQNRFLYFAASPKLYQADFVVPYEPARWIQKELQARDQQNINSDWNKTSLWMFNSQSYQGDKFKIKALLLLSDPDEAERFGDLKTRPFDAIIKASSRKEVEDILQNWATKDGSESPSRARRYKANSKRFDKDVPDSKEEWVKQLQDLMKKIQDAGTKGIESAAVKSYKKGKAALAALDDFLREFMIDSQEPAAQSQSVDKQESSSK